MMRKVALIAVCIFLSSSFAFAQLQVSVVEQPMGVKMGYPVGGSADFTRIFSDKPMTYTQIFEATRGIQTLPMVKIVVLDDGDNKIILGRTDAIGMSELLTYRVSQYVKDKTGNDIYPYLFISGDHTHSGPGRMSELTLFSIAMDTFLQEIYDGLKENVGDAIIEALKPESFRPAKIGYASKKLGEEDHVDMIHTDRRSADDDLYGAGNIEHTMVVVRIDDAETDDPICAFINFPVHGTIIQLSKFRDDILPMSGDAPGGIEKNFEEAFYRKYGKKIAGVFIQSSAADVGPGGGNGYELFQAIDAIGKVAAPAVMQIWEEAGNNMKSDVKITYSWRVVPLAVDPIYNNPDINPSGDRFDYPYGAYGCYDDSLPPDAKDENGCVPLPNPDLIKYERYSTNPIVNIMLQLLVDECTRVISFVPITAHMAAIKIGDFLIVTAPGEPSSAWWFNLRDEVKQKTGISDVFLWGYTLDHDGYILMPDDFDRGEYETSMSFWGRRFSDYVRYHLVQLAEQVKDDKVNSDERAENDHYNPHYGEKIEDYTYTLVAPVKSKRAGDIEEDTRKEVERFEPMRFRWIGGDTVCGIPEIKVQKREGSKWVDALDARGRVLDEKGLSTYLEYGRSAPDCEFYWYLEWETQEYEAGAKYRVNVRGKYSSDGKSCNKTYETNSRDFTLNPNQALLVKDFDVVPPVKDGGDYLLKAKLYYPPNRKIGLRARDPFVNVDSDDPLAGERASSGKVKFTIAPSGESQTSVDGSFNAGTGFFEANFSFDPGKDYEVSVDSAGGQDSYGNTNCQATLPILVQSGAVVYQTPSSIAAVLKRPTPGKKFDIDEDITFEAEEHDGVYGYFWWFGNGDFACGKQVRYAYGAPGDYNAILGVYNGAGDIVYKNFVVRINSDVEIPPDFDSSNCSMNIAVNDCFGSRIGEAEAMCGHCGFAPTKGGGIASLAFLVISLGAIAIWKRALNRRAR